MFDFFDTPKLLIIGIIALLVIPPKDLPNVLRQLGQAVGKLRRMAADFQNQFKDALAEAEIDTLKKDLQSVSDAAKVDLETITGGAQPIVTHPMESPVNPSLMPSPPAEAMIGDAPVASAPTSVKKPRAKKSAEPVAVAAKPLKTAAKSAKKAVKADV